MADRSVLVSILTEAKLRVANKSSVFDYSSWSNSVDGLAELDKLTAQIESGTMPSFDALTIVFAPSGPLQELAIQSGWGDEFLLLADRFDLALSTQDKSCDCNTDGAKPLNPIRWLGVDSDFLDSEILYCPACAQLWLKLLYEDESVSQSGRWYRGAIDPDVAGTLTLVDARRTLESLPEYLVGGSYFNGIVSKGSGAIRL